MPEKHSKFSARVQIRRACIFPSAPLWAVEIATLLSGPEVMERARSFLVPEPFLIAYRRELKGRGSDRWSGGANGRHPDSATIALGYSPVNFPRTFHNPRMGNSALPDGPGEFPVHAPVGGVPVVRAPSSTRNSLDCDLFDQP